MWVRRRATARVNGSGSGATGRRPPRTHEHANLLERTAALGRLVDHLHRRHLARVALAPRRAEEAHVAAHAAARVQAPLRPLEPLLRTWVVERVPSARDTEVARMAFDVATCALAATFWASTLRASSFSRLVQDVRRGEGRSPVANASAAVRLVGTLPRCEKGCRRTRANNNCSAGRRDY